MTGNFQYALVAYKTTPLAEYSFVKGNYRSLALKMLAMIDPNTSNAIVEQGEYSFYSSNKPDGMVFLCLCKSNTMPALRELLLQEIERKWTESYGTNGSTFETDSKNLDFGFSTLCTILTVFNTKRYEKLAQIKQNLLDEQKLIDENIDLANDRADQIHRYIEEVNLERQDKLEQARENLQKAQQKMDDNSKAFQHLSEQQKKENDDRYAHRKAKLEQVRNNLKATKEMIDELTKKW